MSFPLRSLRSAFLPLAASALVCFCSKAEVVVLFPVADTTLFQTEAENNLGALDTFVSGTTATGLSNRTLLCFDLAGQIPVDATLRSVSLTLAVSRSIALNSNTFRLHRMLGPWAEGTGTGANIGAPALQGESTWSARFFPDTPWSSPGAAAATDYKLEPSGEALVGSAGTGEFASTPQLIGDVELWRTNAVENHGWVLVCADEAVWQTARRFASREAAEGQPVLTIEYVRPERLVLEIVPDADTSLFEYRALNNLGASDLAAGSIGVDTNRSRALMHFDVAGALPKDATVTGASLLLHISRSPGGTQAGSQFQLHRLLKSWGEGNKTGLTGLPAEAGEATWFSCFYPDENWSVPGASAPEDFMAESDGQQTVNSYGWYRLDVLADPVITWQTDPEHNFGWILVNVAEDIPYTARRFDSRESPAYAPTLHIEYVQPPHVDDIGITNGMVSLTFVGLARNHYHVEGGEHLGAGEWNTQTNLPLLETTGPVTVSLPRTAPTMFYRIGWSL
jgi:hypothetical protein